MIHTDECSQTSFVLGIANDSHVLSDGKDNGGVHESLILGSIFECESALS